MQTAEVPRSAWQVSTINSPKKCDLPEPRPPYRPLYRTGPSSGSKAFAVGILRMDNDPLDFVNELESAGICGFDSLRDLTPAAVENGVGRRYPGGRCGVVAGHDAGKDTDRGFGMAACQRAYLGKRFGHCDVRSLTIGSP